MNNRTILIIARSILAAFAASVVLAAVGCSNDSEPPSDPSYYKGPMKPKGAPAEGAGSTQ